MDSDEREKAVRCDVFTARYRGAQPVGGGAGAAAARVVFQDAQAQLVLRLRPVREHRVARHLTRKPGNNLSFFYFIYYVMSKYKLYVSTIVLSVP